MGSMRRRLELLESRTTSKRGHHGTGTSQRGWERYFHAHENARRELEGLKPLGLATVGWTDGDLVPEVYAKESKCPERDRRTRRNFAVRRSGWCALLRRSTPYPG